MDARASNRSASTHRYSRSIQSHEAANHDEKRDRADHQTAGPGTSIAFQKLIADSSGVSDRHAVALWSELSFRPWQAYATRVSALLQVTSPTPTYFIPHGGGPCFFIDDPTATWAHLDRWLRGLLGTLERRPSAIIVVSAHWETRAATVNAAPAPGLLFDYHGFPAHTYELRYDAPGSPELAHRVAGLLRESGIAAASETERGLDHGVFVPFLLIAPDATIPIVQLSLVAGLDPELHLAIGAALAPLRRENVLIVGSGMSYHNLRAFFSPGAAPGGERFDAWLTETVTAPVGVRRERFLDWQRAPDARLAHPREEHLLPLMVIAGAAGSDRAHVAYSDTFGGARITAAHFG